MKVASKHSKGERNMSKYIKLLNGEDVKSELNEGCEKALRKR